MTQKNSSLFTYFQFQRVHYFSVTRVHLDFIFHFNVMAATSVCLVIFRYHSNKLGRKFWHKLFRLNLSNYQYNEMWCLKTTQIVQVTFTWFCNFSIFSKLFWISQDASCGNVSWLVYHDAYCIVKLLPKPGPNKRRKKFWNTKLFSAFKLQNNEH